MHHRSWHYPPIDVDAIRARLASGGIFKLLHPESAHFSAVRSVSIGWFNNRYWWANVPSWNLTEYEMRTHRKKKKSEWTRRSVYVHDKPSQASQERKEKKAKTSKSIAGVGRAAWQWGETLPPHQINLRKSMLSLNNKSFGKFLWLWVVNVWKFSKAIFPFSPHHPVGKATSGKLLSPKNTQPYSCSNIYVHSRLP